MEAAQNQGRLSLSIIHTPILEVKLAIACDTLNASVIVTLLRKLTLSAFLTLHTCLEESFQVPQCSPYVVRPYQSLTRFNLLSITSALAVCSPTVLLFLSLLIPPQYLP